MELFAGRHHAAADLRFAELLAVVVADALLQSGEAGTDEALAALSTLEEAWAMCERTSCDLVLVRKMGVSIVELVSSGCELTLESGVRTVARISIPTQIEDLKTRLSAGRA